MIEISPGDQISHFIFGKRIAKGGYGRVYKCHIEGNPKNQFVALKVSPNASAKTLENEKNILDEIQDCGPYFPKKHDAACCNSFYYIAMEYISFSLEKVVIPHDEESRKQKIIYIALRTLDCIQKLHEKNIIHRDIKPPNFLIRKDNTLCLIDFGLSVHYRVNGRHIKDGYDGTIVGTAKFQSIRSHKGDVSSRRDDMESWIYLLLFLYQRGDPSIELWGNYEESEMTDRKEPMAKRALCKIQPLDNIYEKIRKLGFTTQPNYDDYRKQLTDCQTEKDIDLLEVSQDGCCNIC